MNQNNYVSLPLGKKVDRMKIENIIDFKQQTYFETLQPPV